VRSEVKAETGRVEWGGEEEDYQRDVNKPLITYHIGLNTNQVQCEKMGIELCMQSDAVTAGADWTGKEDRDNYECVCEM